MAGVARLARRVRRPTREGLTYLSRLWCVIELFTFMQMGIGIRSIRFQPLCRSGPRYKEDKANVDDQLENFDVSQCKCFNEADKRQMHNMIYAAYGDMSNFNREISQMLQAADVIATN
mmetsp:Transcript_33483/g.101084  ORF Transcript_33483/g.101084 Transcript_33483/m.101084 type:complete len:118 (+) Transcript_33483:321-674(+)